PETNCNSANTPSTIISSVTTRIRLNIRHLPDKELTSLSAERQETLFRRQYLPRQHRYRYRQEAWSGWAVLWPCSYTFLKDRHCWSLRMHYWPNVPYPCCPNG